MPVLINEFEAVAEPAGEPRSDGGARGAPRRLRPVDIVPPLRILAVRAARIRAH